MLPAPDLPHEGTRLEALAQYEPRSPFDEAAYAPILDMARLAFGVPIAFISFLDRHEQVLAVRRGLDVCTTDRSVSFCAHAVARDEMLVVLDAALDARFHDNPLVTGHPHIRFYAGTPLHSPDGQAIGTLCVADTGPHTRFDGTRRSQLRHLAGMVVDKLETRRLMLAGQVSHRRFENIAATSPDSIVCADKDGLITFWNAAAECLFGHASRDAVGQTIDLIVPPRLRRGHDGGLWLCTGWW